MGKDLRILVVCGGVSSEREVSLRSGKAVATALKHAGYTQTRLFDLLGGNISEILNANPDVVFLALHGKGGEDGSIQGYLEQVGIPYTGSNVAASSICMDKILTKRYLNSIGIPTPAAIVVNKDQYIQNQSDWLTRMIDQIGLPMVLKAPDQGSSIGVEMVYEKSEIEQKMIEVFKYGNKILVEEFIQGVEITLPVIGNESPIALPVIEIISENKFYDFEAKYTKGKCHHIIPAKIDAATEKKIKEIGLKTYQEIGCEGFSRIDFIIDEVKGPMVIEINTLPGMTEMSLFPDAARYAGITFENLVDQLIKLALSRNK